MTDNASPLVRLGAKKKAPTAADVDKVINTIGKHVVLRKTGIIEASHSGGGQLKFLGRLLCRQQGESAILVGLPVYPKTILKVLFDLMG